jgi:hypothetical protein
MHDFRFSTIMQRNPPNSRSYVELKVTQAWDVRPCVNGAEPRTQFNQIYTKIRVKVSVKVFIKATI